MSGHKTALRILLLSPKQTDDGALRGWSFRQYLAFLRGTKPLTGPPPSLRGSQQMASNALKYLRAGCSDAHKMDDMHYPVKVDMKGVTVATGLSVLALVVLWLGLRWCTQGFGSMRPSGERQTVRRPAELTFGQFGRSSNDLQWETSHGSSGLRRVRVCGIVARLQRKKDAAAANVLSWFPAARAGMGLRHLRSRRQRALRARARLARARSARGCGRRCSGPISSQPSRESEEAHGNSTSRAASHGRKRPQQALSRFRTATGSYGEAQVRGGKSDSLCEHKKVTHSTDRQLFGLPMLQRAATRAARLLFDAGERSR